jgi:hypothetical protein
VQGKDRRVEVIGIVDAGAIDLNGDGHERQSAAAPRGDLVATSGGDRLARRTTR